LLWGKLFPDNERSTKILREKGGKSEREKTISWHEAKKSSLMMMMTTTTTT